MVNSQNLETKETFWIQRLAGLQDEPDLLITYLMELGMTLLPVLPNEARKKAYLVPGCASRVWIACEVKDGSLFFYGDAEGLVTKGLLALLVDLFAGAYPQELMNHRLRLPEAIHLDRFIGTQRRSGFARMVKRCQDYARAFQT